MILSREGAPVCFRIRDYDNKWYIFHFDVIQQLFEEGVPVPAMWNMNEVPGPMLMKQELFRDKALSFVNVQRASDSLIPKANRRANIECRRKYCAICIHGRQILCAPTLAYLENIKINIEIENLLLKKRIYWIAYICAPRVPYEIFEHICLFLDGIAHASFDVRALLEDMYAYFLSKCSAFKKFTAKPNVQFKRKYTWALHCIIYDDHQILKSLPPLSINNKKSKNSNKNRNKNKHLHKKHNKYNKHQQRHNKHR